MIRKGLIARCLILACIFHLAFNKGMTQIEGLPKEELVERGIKSAIAKLNLKSGDPIYEELVVKEFRFDDRGNCVFKRYLHPFYDVVATEDEYFMTFDLNTNLVEEIHIHRTVGISRQGKDYISLFGQTNDTTILINSYNEFDQIIRGISFQPGTNDSLIVEYYYEDSLRVRSEHFSTTSENEIDKNNFIREYEYDDLKRLVMVKEVLSFTEMYSTKTIRYIEDTDLILSETKENDFRWQINVVNGRSSREMIQNSTFGYKKVYEYDWLRNITKEVLYKNPIREELDDYYAREYTYEDGLLISEQVINQSSNIISLTDRIEYIYDDEGMLQEQRYIYGGEWSRSHNYEFIEEKN